VTASTRSQGVETDDLLPKSLATLCLICGSAGLAVIGELIRLSIVGLKEAGPIVPIWALLNLVAWLITSRALWRRALGRVSGNTRLYEWLYGAVLNTLWLYKVWFEPSGLTRHLRTPVAGAAIGAILAAGVGLYFDFRRAKRVRVRPGGA
jgi:hypothetical protein